jgi:hypothetical protein
VSIQLTNTTFSRFQTHCVLRACGNVIGGLQCSVPIHKRRIYFPCLTFSFLRGRICVIHPKFHQNWLHLTWVTVILWIHHMIQSLLTYNALHNDNVNLRDCFVHFPSRKTYGKHAMFPIVLANWGRSDIPNDCASVSWGRSAAALCQQQSNKIAKAIVSHQYLVWDKSWKIYLPNAILPYHPMVPPVA